MRADPAATDFRMTGHFILVGCMHAAADALRTFDDLNTKVKLLQTERGMQSGQAGTQYQYIGRPGSADGEATRCDRQCGRRTNALQELSSRCVAHRGSDIYTNQNRYVYWPSTRPARDQNRMRRHHALTVTVPLAAIMLSFASCSRDAAIPDSPATAEECDTTLRAGCLLELANESLLEIDDAASSVDAHLELVHALAASGDAESSASQLQSASAAAKRITDDTSRAVALVDILDTATKTQCPDDWTSQLEAGFAAIAKTDEPQRTDLSGKLLNAQAHCGDLNAAAGLAHALPQSDDAQASYKARTLQLLAADIADKRSIAEAKTLIDRIDMGLPYYRAQALIKVAGTAYANGDRAQGNELLQAATAIADDEKRRLLQSWDVARNRVRENSSRRLRVGSAALRACCGSDRAGAVGATPCARTESNRNRACRSAALRRMHAVA